MARGPRGSALPQQEEGLQSSGSPWDFPSLSGRQRGLHGQALLGDLLQTVRGLVLSAQNEQFRIASEPGAQDRRITTDLTILREATLEPQISLAIELVLQMMSECFVGGFVAGASDRAVACSPYCLPVDYHRVPLASVCSDLALACGKHVSVSLVPARPECHDLTARTAQA